jgi:hypothetical protein
LPSHWHGHLISHPLDYSAGPVISESLVFWKPITTVSLAKAPGISPTCLQCSASYFWATSFLKDHRSTHRCKTLLETGVADQESTYFLKYYKPIQNSVYEECDKKHEPYCPSTNIRHHITKLVTQVSWNLGFVHPSW